MMRPRFDEDFIQPSQVINHEEVRSGEVTSWNHQSRLGWGAAEAEP